MAESFQKEVPKARINITLDIETDGARQKKELPLKLLALGNFSKDASKTPLTERQRIPLNKHNFDQVIADLSPRLQLSVPNKINDKQTDLDITLVFHSFKDFHPDQLVKKIPLLNQLIAMRTLLKELKSNLLDNHQFRKTLETYIKDKTQRQQLHQEIQHHAPLNEEI